MTLALVLGGLGLAVILVNYGALLRQLRAAPGQRTPSLIPLLGGLLSYWALRLTGTPHAWLAAVLDPGCYLVSVPLLLLVRARRRAP